MTHSGGKPHKVGYNGQQFEVRATGYPEGGESVIGWSNSSEGAWRMATAIRKAPSCLSSRVIDLHTMNDVSKPVAPVTPDKGAVT